MGNRTIADKVLWVQPCPFSPGVRLAATTAWRSLGIYQFYRLCLSAVLISIGTTLTVPTNVALFQRLAWIYLASIAVSALWMRGIRRIPYATQAQAQLFIDIVMMTVLAHVAGNALSGSAMILAVTIAASSLLVGGRCCLVFAAIAALGGLSMQVYNHLRWGLPAANYSDAGIQGAAFFAIALFAHEAARRTERSEALARQRADDLDNLRELNSHIVQQLHSGILVVDSHANIVTANRAALSLFAGEHRPARLADCAIVLQEAYQRWQNQSWFDHALLSLPAGQQIQVRFSHFAGPTQTYALVFVEDDGLYNQRVQQSKLAALGRLSASIAHEIRNPLSAIGHAAQLLAENPQLDSQDRRLTQIVLDNTIRLEGIVQNVLQISKRTSSRQQLTDLNAWLKRFLATYTHADLFVYDTPPLPCLAWVDAGQLCQIVENLCDNAVKYGYSERGPLTLRVFSHPDLARPCLEVTDFGKALSAEMAEQIFEPFFTTSVTGNGLGLYIARELAELNGAQLSYSAAIHGGAVFRLCLRAVDSYA